MPIRIQLEGGTNLVVDVSLDEWNKAFQRAVKRNTMLEIETEDRRVLAINPHQILYLEEASAEELEPA